ncbi:MAG: hypothetical protein II128_00065 [Atopobiaceae bacterium]|nr:hypothetical protein [Atopobiaceae bacterium]
MYAVNLPDEVMIPDPLLPFLEKGQLDESARSVAVAWVKKQAAAKSATCGFWRKRIVRNVDVCERYDQPECAEFFAFVRDLIEKAWA